MKKEIDADEQEAFIREVTEEVKNDNLKQMWEKYGIYIILLVVLAIVGAVSFEGFKSWRQAKSETWSDTYAYALNLENQGKYDESLKVLEQMEKTGGKKAAGFLFSSCPAGTHTQSVLRRNNCGWAAAGR